MCPRRAVSLLFAVLVSSTALAQSDADRAAARQLAESGIKLRKEGKLAEALDKLQRAQQLVDAPTHLLQIAQIQEHMGQLVESSETYRKLARAPLGANAPAVFVKAKEQGAAELAALEPKVPGLTIVLEPSVTDASVKLDGVVVPPALIGAARPTNPGAHVIDVTAPGYEAVSVRVQLAISEKKLEKISLKASATAAPPVPPPSSSAPPSPGAAPPPPSSSSPPPPPAQPPPAPPGGPNRPRGEYTHDGFYLRIAGGPGAFGLKEELTVSGAGGAGGGSSSLTASGTGFTFDVGLGGTLGGGFVLGGGVVATATSQPSVKIDGGGSGTYDGSVTTTVGGLMLVFYPSPTKGFNVGAIAGSLTVSLSPKDSGSSSSSSRNDPPSSRGFGYSLHAGYDFWVGPQSSLGLSARYMGGSASDELGPAKVTHTPSIFSLQFGYTYH